MTTSRRGAARATLLIAILALVAVACGNRELDRLIAAGRAPGPEGGVPQVQPENSDPAPTKGDGDGGNGGGGKTLVVGGIFHRSGPIASIGLDGCYEGVQAWVADANAHGGVNGYRFKFVGYDDGVDPQRALPLARRLINDDKLDVFLGNCSDFTAEVVAPETVKAGIPVIGPAIGGAPAWYANANWFPVYGDQQWMYPYFAVQAMKQQGVKRAGIIYPGSVPTGLEGYRFTKRYLAEEGIELVYEGSHDILQSDWTAYVSGLKSKGAQVVAFTAATRSTMTAFFKSMRQQSWDGKVFAPWPGYYPGLPKAVGNIDGKFFVTAPHREVSSTGEAGKGFTSAMKQYFPKVEFNTAHVQGWMAGELLGAGLEKLGSKPYSSESLMAALRTLKDWQGTFGPPMTFVDGPNKEPTICNAVLEVSDSAFRHFGDAFHCAGPH